MTEQLEMNLQPQVKAVVKAMVEIAGPTAKISDICRKVIEFNAELEYGWVSDTLHNSVRRAIYEHLGDDKDGVFVREGRGFYRLSIKILYNAVICADAWQFVKLLPDNSVQSVITDPPWTVLDRHRAWGTTTRMTSRNWFETKDIDAELVNHIARVLQDGRHAYIFMPALSEDTAELFPAVLKYIKDAGLRMRKGIVWDKMSIGMGYSYRYQYETILYITKGKARQLNNLGIPDVLKFKRVKHSEQVHDCQKPVELVKTLVEQSTDPGDLVLDLFAGSGATGKACKETGRNYLLVDIGIEWYEEMNQELEPALSVNLKGV